MNNKPGCFAILIGIVLFILGPIMLLIESLFIATPEIRTFCIVWLIGVLLCYTFIREKTIKIVITSIPTLIYSIMIAEWYGNDVLDGYYGGGGGGETIGMALMPFATLVSLYFIGNAIAAKLSAIKAQKQASKEKTASPTASKVATPAEVVPQRSEEPATSTIKATQSNSMEGANTVKCPVCKNETGNSCSKCSICGFSDLQRTFISTEDASDWFDRVVLPYRQRWASEQQRKKEASMSASTLYNQMQSAQFSQVSNFVKNEVSLFDYAPFQDGIELTSYNGEVSHVDVPEQINGLKVRRLGENLFTECQNLNSVHLPTTLREIGTKAFYHSTVSAVNIPSEVTRIGESAFSRSKLTEITFPQGIKCVEKSVCSACQKLQTVVILGATTISDSAFGGCYALQHLILPDGLESIGQSAFSNTFPLTRIVVPATVKKIAMNFAATSSGGVVGGAQAQIKHIAVLNDNIEWEYSFGSIYTNYSLQRKYDMMAVYYCNNGSTTQKYTREKQLNMRPLSQFPR